MKRLAAHTKAINFLIVYLLICQLLDFSFTYWGVSNFGIEAEGNPIVSWVMQKLGILPGLLIVKSLAVLLLVIFKHQKSKQMLYILTFLAGLYTIVVLMWAYAFVMKMEFLYG